MATPAQLDEARRFLANLGISASEMPNLFTPSAAPSRGVRVAADQPFIDPEQMRRDFDPTTPTVIVDTRPPMTAAPAKADPLAAAREYDAMIAKRNEAARAAVLGRMRQQQQEQANRPTVTTEGGTRQITGRYGTGSITPKRTGPAMIEGKPAAQWFQETEARQRRASKEYADTEKSKEEIRKKRLPNV